MKTQDGKVWDDVRGRWLVLTPEEWVRQHTIEQLTLRHGIEPHRIGREVLLAKGQRADLVVYNRAAQPVLIIECKAQSVPITQDVFEQVARYNMAMGRVAYLAVTNGIEFHCCQFDHTAGSYKFIDTLPSL